MNVENERKNFEQWVTKVAPLNAFFETYPDGKYQCESNQLAWEGWQARAAWRPIPSVDEIETVLESVTEDYSAYINKCRTTLQAQAILRTFGGEE